MPHPALVGRLVIDEKFLALDRYGGFSFHDLSLWLVEYPVVVFVQLRLDFSVPFCNLDRFMPGHLTGLFNIIGCQQYKCHKIMTERVWVDLFGCFLAGRGGALPGWSIEVIQIAIAILITMIAYSVLIQYGAE